MKLAVSSYSFGGYAAPDRLGFKGIMDKALEMGFEGIEIVENEYTSDTNVIGEIKEYSKSIGLPIIAFAAGADFTKNDCTSLSEEIERVCGLVDIAAKLGVKKMRHDVSYGMFSEGSDYSFDSVLEVMAEGCRAVAEYAKSLGVLTMFENHGYFVQDSGRVEKLIRAVDHENFGYLIDLGNFMCADESPIEAVGKLAKYATHAHAKDFNLVIGAEGCDGGGWFPTRSGNRLRGAVIGEGDANCEATVKLLMDADYDDYITIEYEGVEDNLEGVRRGLENLKRFTRK